MLSQVNVRLQPLITRLNLPTVIKSTIFPGDSSESLVIATQVGEIFYLRDEYLGMLLDISQDIIALGATSGGYDERGLLGMAFHPDFSNNGLFYLHYSLAGSQGPGALSAPFEPNPCNLDSLDLRWTDRETRYDHIDTVEEWMLLPNGQPRKIRTLLNLRRPFFNHNGVNSLNFSPETGRLVLTTGDGGSGFDPFNLSQNIMEIAGKILEIDISSDIFFEDLPAATRFDELPPQLQENITVIAKGIRNIPGISFHRYFNNYIKYVGNVGQGLVESIFTFENYTPIPVTEIVQSMARNSEPNQEGLVNLGWRGWEGNYPTSIIRNCPESDNLREIITAYYDDTIIITDERLRPLSCYYHDDPRPGKFNGTALTGVQVYLGESSPNTFGGVIFTDFARSGEVPARGVLAYVKEGYGCNLLDYNIIDVNYDFGASPAFYTCLGTNQSKSKLYLGVYGSMKVTDFNLGTVFEVIPRFR